MADELAKIGLELEPTQCGRVESVSVDQSTTTVQALRPPRFCPAQADSLRFPTDLKAECGRVESVSVGQSTTTAQALRPPRFCPAQADSLRFPTDLKAEPYNAVGKSIIAHRHVLPPSQSVTAKLQAADIIYIRDDCYGCQPASVDLSRSIAGTPNEKIGLSAEMCVPVTAGDGAAEQSSCVPLTAQMKLPLTSRLFVQGRQSVNSACSDCSPHHISQLSTTQHQQRRLCIATVKFSSPSSSLSSSSSLACLLVAVAACEDSSRVLQPPSRQSWQPCCAVSSS
ncbi:hypothetical protein EGW08_000385 [Elysia chlorotica]|uniref:Uncharacterized protein n=1 Tax=Elysia chlorotica TaxID=188477 RepID=A0A433UDH3_ELYCH|nr:hypothetical protein EGW08_000385 [Elysia chlorotica]